MFLLFFYLSNISLYLLNSFLVIFPLFNPSLKASSNSCMFILEGAVLSFCIVFFGLVISGVLSSLSLSGFDPDDDDAAPCAISGVCCIAFSIFFFSSLFVLLFAFGLVRLALVVFVRHL